ncbi:nucleoside-diphosphate kinase [Singulisphaera sp. PoT]|uniref:nucleoside-diphosphate kinase n=1 Tax=Singulisphaera sp. PoT TaxID=3411797 RepID=UPI003BF61414
MQKTLIIFKPDCVQRRLVGQILQRFESKGLRIAGLKLIQVDRALGEKHYAEHQGKPFFEGLIQFITGGPVVVGILEGNEAITVVRTLLGATNGTAAAPGTIRGDFSISKQNNLLHGSDSPESAEREIALWFRPEEIVDYSVAGSEWVFGGA